MYYSKKKEVLGLVKAQKRGRALRKWAREEASTERKKDEARRRHINPNIK
jgi:hypothetical protein